MMSAVTENTKLYRATIEAMPGNPAGKVMGVRTGLWRMVIYKRRGAFVTTEDFVEIAASHLSWDEALDRSSKLNREFASQQEARLWE